MRWLVRVALAIALAGAFCSGPAIARAAFACPVTIPNDSQPPPGGGGIGPGSLKTHGNGLLWTILPDDGVWRVAEIAMQRDGSFDQKFVWWRRPIDETSSYVGGMLTAETTFAGNLHIDGRRLDAAADPLAASTRHEGVHVGSTITFPSGGCWEITGTAGADAMTFTVYMLPPGEPLPNTAATQTLPVAAWGAALLACAAYLVHRKRACGPIRDPGTPQPATARA